MVLTCSAYFFLSSGGRLLALSEIKCGINYPCCCLECNIIRVYRYNLKGNHSALGVIISLFQLDVLL